MSSNQVPELKFTDKDIYWLVDEQLDDDTIIVCDGYSYHTMFNNNNHHHKTRLVMDNRIERVEEIKKGDYSRVFAVGGCTALDVGRACATEKELINIPTILSTSCISVDVSVLRYPDGNRLKRTTSPRRTVISLSSIGRSSAYLLKKWSQSGFGDLFANISASIDMEHDRGKFTYESVRDNVPECFESLEWVENQFKGYNEDCLRRLAIASHNASVAVISRGDTKLSAAGEHKLYYRMIEQQDDYTRKKPTHGQVVAFGTLLSGRIFAEITGDHRLYSQLRTAYEKLGLPIDYDDLQNIGIERRHIVQGLQSIADSKTLLGNYFSQGDYTLLDKVFERGREDV